jgi:predicted lipoprotein with Yx(FWY)xxD motif
MMRYPVKTAGPVLAACLLLAACGSSSNSTNSTQAAQPAANTTSASGETVKTASTSLGTVLVNSSGMTLYHLGGEQGGKFICNSSACTAIWHPLTVTAGSVPGGDVGSLGTVKRPEGSTQVTYKGAPLYTFAEDHQAGETNGQGIKDVGTWTVTVTAPPSSGAATQPSAPATGGGSEGAGGSEGGGAYRY